jgi:TrmH family RNA methyltransferase
MKVERVTSTANPRVKAVAKLRDRRDRERAGRIVIDGARELRRALVSGVDVLEVYSSEPLCRSDDCAAVLQDVASRSIPRIELSPEAFARIAYGERAEGVVGVAATPGTDLDRIALPGDALIAVLAGVEKPGNVGAVLRSADGAGISALVLADERSDLFNPNCIRASLGTVFTVPVAAASSADVLAWLRARRLGIVAARVEGSVEYTEVDLRGPTAIVLGAEATGLGPEWTGADIVAASLPMLGVADSLNVSASAAVLFYEALRQRRTA